MGISKDKVVSLTYELRIDKSDGKVIESLANDAPLTFLFGSGSLLPKFEDNIAGLEVGDEFSFTLVSEDAYGEVNENAVINLPIGTFEINGKVDYEMIKPGNNVPMQDGNGNRLNGIIKEVSTDSVKMDFNHPLAGNDLFFSGKITGIREATNEEKMHGHMHQSGGCNGCSGCGENEGNCC
ncbi:MAG: peptidylprolyl isomerase [Bacteroidales bacterium]|nr:peptidylprolyl isomerase [Bacteroidales bacterium]